jgi:hypothetical protein
MVDSPELTGGLTLSSKSKVAPENVIRLAHAGLARKLKRNSIDNDFMPATFSYRKKSI